ncbi:MAG: alpha/beta fold hydrolase [Sphingomonadales bacterium]
MASWVHGYWSTEEGLRLHYRDYPGPQGGVGADPPIICIPGLTRNARDFEAVAGRLAQDRRVICVELRGRGESAYARDPATYNPATYIADLEALIAELALDRFVLFGTSLGGIVTAGLAVRDARRIAGALINDIGPVIDPRGIERIRGIVGRSQSWPTWLHAARHFAESQAAIYPKWTVHEWLVHAKRLCRLNASGRIIADYDMRIAEPFKGAAPPTDADFTPLFDALRGVPTLIVRGALSDILSAQTLEAMLRSNPAAEGVTVPAVGHTPTLEEAPVAEAIDRLLARAREA